MIKVIRAKLHGIRVTGAELNYHGSISLDPEICRKAGLYPLEFVYVWNKNSGQRISTYIIHGKQGSRCCILNGAAARTCQTGDELIICGMEYINTPEEIRTLTPQVLIFDGQNNVVEQLQYSVTGSNPGDFLLQTLISPECEAYP